MRSPDPVPIIHPSSPNVPSAFYGCVFSFPRSGKLWQTKVPSSVRQRGRFSKRQGENDASPTSPSVSKRTVTKDNTRSVVNRLTNWQAYRLFSIIPKYGVPVLHCSMAPPGPILDEAVNSPPLRREGKSRTGPCFPT
ncbi:hypothetical protein BO82DRAFT_13991 [Aspergillus uvarum CBS 121591]|uniref:Uncharacterized protein n=1 Tax=Aspergillus uvarum CBS 121591 TaxID=1448315 RepID=A0A319BWJ1_9EURO|nr:hypothetical protein BO82DRAFT_13991 [Aspergillus uvarum CBS 121591]PYH75730.1 hypothetical protein BO82DRAFT_13991 [Aspergillus uvarum CBS 121591]